MQVTSVLVFWLYTLERGVLQIQDRWEDEIGRKLGRKLSFDEVQERAQGSWRERLRLLVLTPYYLLQASQPPPHHAAELPSHRACC